MIGVQLASIPILVSRWGAHGYGVWLILSALPTMMALCDLGLGTAAGAEITRCVARQQFDGALCAFQSTWIFVSLVSLALLACGIFVFLAVGDTGYARLGVPRRTGEAALILMGYAVLAMQANLLFIAFRSSGLYALGSIITGLMYPVESGLMLAAVFLRADFVGAAMFLLVGRLSGLVIQIVVLRKRISWIRFSLRHASISEIRQLARPAIAAMGFPFSTALNVQGVTVVLGIVLSPVAAAIFGAIRTATRVPLQLVGILTRATMPEITAAHAVEDWDELKRLVLSNMLAVAVVATPAAIGTILFGEIILNLMMHNSVHVPAGLFFVMTATMVLQTLWNTVGGFLFALNLQQRFAHIYALLSVASTGICYLTVANLGMVWAALLVAVVDALMAMTTIRSWNRATGLDLFDIVAAATLKLTNKRSGNC